MLRSTEKSHVDQDPYFRWRGGAVTRIENLSDIVFALSLSLIAVASAPPTTFSELISVFRSGFAFAFGFVILLMIWNYHYLFFRRYGLSDQKIVFLNALLLFVVLMFVYPLRFLADFMFVLIPAFFTNFDTVAYMVGGIENGENLLIIYSFGYAVVFLIIAGLYGHAASKREALELDETEYLLTRRSRASALIQAGVAMFVAGVAGLTPIGPWAGPLYFLIGVAEPIVQRRFPAPLQTRSSAV
ncbi:TMEM175 family protein [Hyphococcus flavus]|uniref:TMEM175 family protein n=1 Tax=Hyphococcus flavus TaxID=1866326 RepID=A0AAF0CI62_9PROT|nr:TMEM175 family protein [Hyphococcus flavus]WDI32547.1 TMEM175 family protein [Hyphococcus flavus]